MPENVDSLAAVLDLLRSGGNYTRPELAEKSKLGRAIIAQRVGQLIERGLVEDGELGPSTGGRAARQLRFCKGAGHVLVAAFGATGFSAGLLDLRGCLIEQYEEPFDIAVGPGGAFDRLDVIFDALLAGSSAGSTPVWGIGIGLPGPVEFASGRPVAPPIMPGWDGYPVRERLMERYAVPVWVDNEVNTMALGELRAGVGIGQSDLVYLKIGTGIGSGLISGGRLHRGAQGCAGDIGHMAMTDGNNVICRCGNVGCLEALAGGAAIARDGQLAAERGRSRYLADLASLNHPVTAADVAAAAQHGDAFSVDLLSRCGRRVGEALATVVNIFNPSLIIVGGSVAKAGDLVIAAIRETVYGRSLPLATRDLRITRSSLGDTAGLIGAAFMVIDELFSRTQLERWIDDGSPIGHTEIAPRSPGTRPAGSPAPPVLAAS
jgi:glucokinase-like ROK family protein